MSEEDAEDAWAQAKEQTRKDTPAKTETDDADEDDGPDTLADAVAEAYEKIDAGDRSSNLTLRDPDLAALFHGLERMDQLPDVGEQAAATLERDPDDTESRAAVLRSLVRIGLKETDKSVIQAGKDGRDQFRTSDEF